MLNEFYFNRIFIKFENVLNDLFRYFPEEKSLQVQNIYRLKKITR